MFETRLQTYWADADPAGLVFFPNFFKFFECAEEEMFRAFGVDRMKLMTENHVWLPRVEAFSQYRKPILSGEAVFIQLTATFKGLKTVRLDFKFLHTGDRSLLAEGYVVEVCIDDETRKSTPIPEAIRAVFAKST